MLGELHLLLAELAAMPIVCLLIAFVARNDPQQPCSRSRRRSFQRRVFGNGRKASRCL
jgi:hypothetical protein